MSVVKPAPTAASTKTGSAASAGSDRDLERQILGYAKIGVPIAVLVGAGIAGSIAGPPAAVLVLAGGALVAVIAILWASLRLLLGETPLSGADAYALGAPRAEEEQKQAVLRALKDLEFERSVGKISDEDYAELVAKYRAEAKRLLRLLDADAQPRREQVAALVMKRLRRAGLVEDGADDADESREGAAVAPREGAESGSEAKRERGLEGEGAAEERATEQESVADEDDGERGAARAAAEKVPKTVQCASCGTVNDEDAVFCKKCGTRCGSSAPEASGAAADEAAVGQAGNERPEAS